MSPLLITRDDLAAMLRLVEVADVVREAGISAKTVYRLRHKQANPSLDDLHAIVDAVRRIKLAAAVGAPVESRSEA